MIVLELSALKISIPIPGLGIIRKFSSLSQKRITKSVRNILRNEIDNFEVKVSCTADFHLDKWNGICWIDNQQYRYHLFEK